MFDIGWSELVVIGVVALIAIGPKELPGVLRSVGFWMGKVRRMAAEFQGQFQEAMREAEMSDLKKHADDLNDAAKQLTSNFDPYDTFKESTAAKPAADAPASDTTAASAPPESGEVKAEPTPDSSQVVAMPDTPPAPETTATEIKAPEPASPPPEPVRREA
jgi:sec-independent protein translocase protein TatB